MAFIDQDEFEATDMLSCLRAPCCDKHQFCAEMLSTQTVFKIIENCGLNKNTRNGTLTITG